MSCIMFCSTSFCISDYDVEDSITQFGFRLQLRLYSVNGRLVLFYCVIFSFARYGIHQIACVRTLALSESAVALSM